jgi:hypothetical protein
MQGCCNVGLGEGNLLTAGLAYRGPMSSRYGISVYFMDIKYIDVVPYYLREIIKI